MSKNVVELYRDDRHVCYLMRHHEEEDPHGHIPTNQFLIVSDGVGALVDPGGMTVFETVYGYVQDLIDPKDIKYLFISHQDPDVCSSLIQWQHAAPYSEFVISQIWMRFIPYYGALEPERIYSLGGHGDSIKLSDFCTIEAVPSHFLHSPGAFSYYDNVSKTLFSGDIGTAIFGDTTDLIYMSDFSKLKKNLEVFHTRYMASQKACRAWVHHVNKLDVARLAPHHGVVIEQPGFREFLSWFRNLKCGVDLM